MATGHLRVSVQRDLSADHNWIGAPLVAGTTKLRFLAKASCR